MTDNSNTAIIPAPSTAPAALAAMERYGRSANTLYGTLLRFSGKTGQWTAGAQGTEIPAGTQLAAIVPMLAVGYVKWVSGEPEQVMQPIGEGYDPGALRGSLGDVDQGLWPKDDSGRPSDPWRECAALPLRDLKTGSMYTYSTSSDGGVRAVKKLAGVFAWQTKAAPETTANCLPIIALSARSYVHSDRRRGLIHVPVLDGIDWVPAAEVLGGVKAEEPPPELFEDHRSGKTKKRRKSL